MGQDDGSEEGKEHLELVNEIRLKPEQYSRSETPYHPSPTFDHRILGVGELLLYLVPKVSIFLVTKVTNSK